MSNYAFYAYPSVPHQIGDTVEEAVRDLRIDGVSIKPWPQLDVAGRFIAEGILEAIDKSMFVIADVTKLNFNVTFEIGYSIGKGKRTILTLNSSLTPQEKEITHLGLFDTIGQLRYTNTGELLSQLRQVPDFSSVRTPDSTIDRQSPLFRDFPVELWPANTADRSRRVYTIAPPQEISFTF